MTWGDVGAFFAVVGVMVSCLVVAVIDVWWEQRKWDKKNRGERKLKRRKKE
ncbi:hypothetical protein ES703_118309 [subsurface metagenome]